MKIQIEQVSNGFIISDDDHEQKILVQEDPCSDARTYAALLRELYVVLGHFGSRYDEERVYVVVAPGDKHEKWSDSHNVVIFGGENE